MEEEIDDSERGACGARLSEFESILWTDKNDTSELSETPLITPGVLSGNSRLDYDGAPTFEGITFGVHWNSSSYPAWTGRQPIKDLETENELPPTPSILLSGRDYDTNMGVENQWLASQFSAPFDLEFIAAMINQVREICGFQNDAAINVFELLMSQLDSRASRRGPLAALHSLHRDYISGTQSNYRKWYFASQMDQIDHEKDMLNRKRDHSAQITQSLPQMDGNRSDGNTPSNSSENHTRINSDGYDVFDSEKFTLQDSEAVWDFHFLTCSDAERLVDLIIYLLCWTEANQVRFMPECLAFIVKCVRDYYYSRFPVHPQHSREIEDVEPCFFLNKIITPIYNCYRSFNFTQTENGCWLPREGDHKDFIGYDDMNQLFWYRDGIQRLKVSSKSVKQMELINNPGGDDLSEIDMSSGRYSLSLVEISRSNWFLALETVQWHTSFGKTYRELRSWLHNITNFSRIWILHASVFWFYLAFNMPSFYTVDYNYMNPEPPKTFVRWSIVSLGGLIGPLITLLGLFGEWRFVPRKFSGAKPIISRAIPVILLMVLLAVPAFFNLLFNPWTSSEDLDYVPADVISYVLFTLALVYTAYFSFQPLDNILSSTRVGLNSKESDEIGRKFLANKLFTASFPARNRNDALLSWFMCLLIFAAKFVESYFFMTLSIRDPLRELGIMDLADKCVGDKYLFGKFLCHQYPLFILVGIIITDMALFFLDTYLWYVIINALTSVSIALKQGTSVWTPWRNIYSQLSQRISTKLLAPSTNAQSYTSRAYSIRVVWNSIVDSMHRNHLLSREQALRLIYVNSMTQEPRFFTMEEDGKALEGSSGYRASGAYRRISFFAQSLSTTMQPAMAVKEMPSFTVLIPHYKEKMVLGLSESIKAEMGAKITILEYLQKLYPQDWENFVQALHFQNKADSVSQLRSVFNTPGDRTSEISSKSSSCRIVKPEPYLRSSISTNSNSSTFIKSDKSHRIAIQKLGFSTLDPNDTDRTRLWCSERTQTLFRTLCGFSKYTNALKVLHCAEEYAHNATPGTSCSEKELRDIEEVCQRKFRLLVSMQLYSSFTLEQLREVETIISCVPELTVSYVERDRESDVYYSCLFDSSCQLLETGRRKPRMRIKLSGNPILGDGKSDNQNSALPFYRGEYIQLVDANQDNYLEECLKIRNVLMEFEAGSILNPASTSTNLSSQTDFITSCPTNSPYSIAEGSILDLEAQTGVYSSITVLNPGPSPIAIVGAREYIFSENIGVLGDVAAGKEQTFGTLYSRTLAKIGAKLHYGHPDFLNAVYMTTRGGVSKGQRGLHLNEDIYAGMTAVQRGGQIRHSEYFQCGKGRDLGFVSILNFTAKIGAGMAEQMLSREYFYMGAQLPFDRFITFYYAHPGFHLNNAFIMISLEMLLMVILWISSIASVSTICKYDRDLGPMAPHRPAGCQNVLPLLEWIQRCVVSIFLVFFVTLCPLLFQELTEKGFVRSLGRIARHFGSLSMLFEVFVCRIYARSFWEDMSLGGAKYVATGRGLATSRIPFYRLYAGYHSEIVCGLKAAGVLTFASVVLWSPSYLWFWATTFSLCLCPVLYNPHQFAFTDFFLDYRKLVLWFWNSTSSITSCSIGQESWSSFNREIREKLTGVKKRKIASESTRPALKNAIFSEAGAASLSMVSFGVPYIFIGSQKVTRNQEIPQVSALLRVTLIALIPMISNMVILLIGLLVSMMIHLVGRTTSHANIIAMTVHILSLLALILSYWILYVLESGQFTTTLLGVMVVASIHRFLHVLLTILLVRRQRNRTETNDPWWTGRWQYSSWQHLLKAPLVITEEYLVKIVETLQFAYDFMVCHIILSVQTPLLLVPYIDKLHVLFLLWLKPSATKAASKSASVQRKRKLVVASRVFCAIFIVNLGALVIMVTFPLYAPTRWLNKVEPFLRSQIAW